MEDIKDWKKNPEFTAIVQGLDFNSRRVGKLEAMFEGDSPVEAGFERGDLKKARNQRDVYYKKLIDFVSLLLSSHEQRIRERFREVENRIMYSYMKIDGTYKFPNSWEGDIIKMVSNILSSLPKKKSE
jgi:hypothetical protein